MTRWILYLLASIPAQIVAWIVTPALPLFARPAFGFSNNASTAAIGPRLPPWLSWFDTPDNSLLGDANFANRHGGGYWSMVAWLYRNSLYGFKWTVLAAPITQTTFITGDPSINYHIPRFGIMRARSGDFWQWKCVKPIGRYCLVFNFGWLLDAPGQRLALFMFSPRIKKLKNA